MTEACRREVLVGLRDLGRRTDRVTFYLQVGPTTPAETLAVLRALSAARPRLEWDERGPISAALVRELGARAARALRRVRRKERHERGQSGQSRSRQHG